MPVDFLHPCTHFRPTYPAELEQWWLKRACAELRRKTDHSVLHTLDQEVAALSDLFTTDRVEDFGAYHLDDRALLAYGLYFFPQSMMRVRYVMDELMETRGWKPPADRAARVLDLGAGTGAATVAIARKLSEAGVEGQIHALEQSSKSLSLLRDLFQDLGNKFWPGISLRTHRSELRHGLPQGEWDLIVCGFSLNEFFPDMLPESDGDVMTFLRVVLRKLAPGGILLLCEPALLATSARLERLREIVLEEKLARVAAPCLHEKPCPMLERGKEWCHEVRLWKPTRSMQVLNKNLHRKINLLKWSFLALSPEFCGAPGGESPGVCRLTAPMHRGKGRIDSRGCACDGSLYPYEFQTRGLKASGKKTLLAYERGDLVEWSDPRALGDPLTIRAQSTPQAISSFEKGPSDEDEEMEEEAEASET